MKGRGSKQKGSRAELEVAGFLEEWLQRTWRDAVVRRTPGSGGWVSGRDAFGSRGDVMVKLAPFSWCVEVKRREGWSFENLVNGGRSPVWGWWKHACSDAEVAKLEPMLWVRQNNEPWLVLVTEQFASSRPRAQMPDFGWREREVVGYWARRMLAQNPRVWIDE